MKLVVTFLASVGVGAVVWTALQLAYRPPTSERTPEDRLSPFALPAWSSAGNADEVQVGVVESDVTP